MPIVRIDMWEGRTKEQKEKLARKITDAFIEIGTAEESVQVEFCDFKKENWAIKGKLCG